MKLSKGYEEEQHTLQEEQTSLEKELQKEEKQSVDVKAISFSSPQVH